MAEPETPPNRVEQTTVTWPRPPRTWPTRDEASAIIRSDNPPFIISSPVKMNSGMASRTTEAMSDPICWNTTIGGSARYSTVASVAPIRQKATGTPRISNRARTPNRMMNSMLSPPARAWARR